MSYERKLVPEAEGGRRRLTLSGAVTAAPDVFLGVVYVALLVDRSLLSEATVTRLAWAIPTEFAVVHCSGFLALPWVARWKDVRKRALYAGGLVALYTLVLAIVSLAVHGWWPLAIFWGLMLNRLLAVVLGDLPDDRAFTAWAMAWAGGTTLYVVAVLVGAVTVGGASVKIALVIGFVYFTLVGLSELTGWAWVHRWQQNAAKRRARSR